LLGFLPRAHLKGAIFFDRRIAAKVSSLIPNLAD
jgi:hypothetical protein